MKKNKTLLILAGGMGSRFANNDGEQKQIAKVGPKGEFLIDYSIKDAIRAGFTKVVFIIKNDPDQLKAFQNTVGDRISGEIEVEYALQDTRDLPEGYSLPISEEGVERTKPWGTAQAIMAAKRLIREPFVIINADDYYGRTAYEVAANFLDKNEDENCYSVVGYQVKKTLSENGAVKRGVCIKNNGELTDLVESNIIKENDKIIATPLDETKEVMILNNDSLVSMNLLCFMPSIFAYLDKKFPEFLDKNLKTDPMTSEFLIPDVLSEARKEGYAKVKLLSTVAKWYGMTYYEDKEIVIQAIRDMIADGEYEENLWGKPKKI